MSKLVVITKGIAAAPRDLGDGWVTIGRAKDNFFQIDDASISDRHCEVRLRGDELLVRDLSSSSGTFMAGEKISEGTLKPGQTLRLGDVELQLAISVPAETQARSFTNRMLATRTVPGALKLATKIPSATESRPFNPAESGGTAAKKYQVLFVDDNPEFLEAFTGMCSVLSKQTWEVHSAASADQALAQLQHKPVDLVVLDINMPTVDGIQLLSIIGRRYFGVKIAVLTGKVTEANRAACLSGGAELFIEKAVSPDGIKRVFNMLNDLVSWTHHEGFSGALRQVHLQEVIQMECIGRHSSILEVRQQQMLGLIYIEAGTIIHAAVDALTGEPAFNRLLSLAGGEFKLKPFTAPPHRTIHSNWETLLMEAARYLDEETVTSKKPVEVPVQPASPSAIPTAGEPSALGGDFVVVATYDGEWKRTDESKK
jgi:CheY-like chemotaxis protein